MLSGSGETGDCVHHPPLICPILLSSFILIIKIIRGFQMARSISQAILDVLAEAGARDVFGVVGDVINPFVLETINDPRFNWITVRHEEHAGYAAAAQSELSGAIGVCAGTAGPGALHLINGLYNAQKEGGAVVAITGQVPTAQRGSDFHKEMDLTKVFDDVCAYQAVIETPAQVPRMIQIAVQKALAERAVVRIEVAADIFPKDILGEHYTHPMVHQMPRVTPPLEELEKAAEILRSGKRVTVYCGIGCRDSKSDVLALASKLGAPIGHTLRAKDIFDYSDGPVVGLTGNIGSPAGFHAVNDCDVLLMLGTDFPYSEFLPDGRPIIQVDQRIDHIGRRGPVSLGLVGDAGETVRALLPLIEAEKKSSEFRDRLLSMRDKWLKHVDSQASLSREDEPLHPQLFAKAVSDSADDDAIFAVDVGECTVWTARNMSMAQDRRMVGGFNHGSLGPGLPTALGAAALFPSRQVWALCGDGGFCMSMNDFVTAVRYNWPIKVLVFNNSELGFVAMEMQVAGMPKNDEATGLTNPDFAAYAKACGGDGVRVEHAADIVPAIEQAIASDKPFIIDAIVSSGELVMPPHIKIDEVWGFGLSKIKEAVLGVKGDHEVWKEWRDEFMGFRS
ncbi:ubiquinone-dependent pyruvate dehydrogenase [Halieaceae bacterium IMCC11814]|uniref:Ubiquinone-dependent pyruvate dehydrogenase n=2 Tax=Candidatus Marimicrobium litorale TaxID=2518991 RepID=A0ABT3T9K0_9GAMM|nr:ubiquinone-dependent pyruvate dehydrogenase [Candidatus Marimicrobium litorale]